MISFQAIESDQQLNPTPLVLIDISGSTGTSFKDEMTVRSYEFKVAFDLCQKSGCQRAHLITWSNHAKLHENVELNQFHKIMDCTQSEGGTTLICGLDCVHEKYFDQEKITEIIIITDGEIQDDKEDIVSKFTELTKHPIQIKIIAVEPNNKDYFNSTVSVGNNLYKIIRNGKLTRLVERFSIFNRHENEFINMSNPRVKMGYLPYGDQMFLIKDFNKFVQFMKDEIKVTLGLIEQTRPKMLKLIQNLSLTIYNYTKDKSYQNQLLIIDLFSNLLRGTSYYSDMRTLLLNEVNNHMTGKASTFSELKKARYTKIENTIIDLMNDTQKAITSTPKDYMYSFILLDKDGHHYVIKSYDQHLGHITIGSTTYNNCCLELDHYQIPLMFDFDNANNTSALQWIKLIYSQRLNLSISNEYLYYYLLCDAYLLRGTEAANLYGKYVELALNDFKYGTDVTLIQDMQKTNMITVPYGILQDVITYNGLKIKPLTLYYLVCHQYLIQYIKDRSIVIENLRKFCQKDIMEDLGRNQPIDDWSLIEQALQQLHLTDVQMITINRNEVTFLKQHQYLADVDCPSRVGIKNNDGEFRCELCNSIVEYIKIEHNGHFNQIENIRASYLFDKDHHIHLGQLDGLPDEQLLMVNDFATSYTSFSVDNIMVVDPISNARLKVTTQEDFVKSVDLKYPFLKDVNMTNIALCGGFVRSILLKQQMKDFDFFFYGLHDDTEYINRVKSLAIDLIRALKRVDPEYKFAVFYKPMFNVIEVICYEDPKNHIKEDFTLDYFDKYRFKSMKKYKGKQDSNRRERKKEDINMKYYFEDNDEHGVKMKYRLQLVMCKYETILDIFRSFDMFPAMVAFDGQHVYFTKKSLLAYQYMINEIDIRGGTDLVKHRVNKYFKYGFAIVFPPSTRQWHNEDYENDYSQEGIRYRGTNEGIGPLKFKVRQMVNNIIYVNHNSNIEQLLERNLKLEKKAKKKGNALYTSSMFCSFVAVLRYIKINEINYAFPIGDAVYDLFEGDLIKLKNTVQLKFFSEQKSIYKTTEWYDKFVKSIIFNKYHE